MLSLDVVFDLSASTGPQSHWSICRWGWGFKDGRKCQCSEHSWEETQLEEELLSLNSFWIQVVIN